jgi:hypothetical protein
MRRSLLALGVSVAAVALSCISLRAAELRVPRAAAHPARLGYCGPCGCLGVAYVYHRELRSTYGLGFDPRNYDTTQPHYYFGPIRAYPRYFVEGAPVPHQCWG